jgi:inner membrane protein
MLPAMERWAARLELLAPAVVFAVDALLKRTLPLPVTAALDEAAHLATADLLLRMLCPRAAAPCARAARLAAVLIDLDHVPKYAGWRRLVREAGRPYSHSLLAIAVLLAIAARSADLRQPALAAAFGLATHLFRDLADENGAPLLWPAVARDVRIPYGVYAATLLFAAAVAARRARQP